MTPDPANPLEYADPSRHGRRRRRLWLVALVASALAVGVVGRLLYLRVRPAIAARVEAVAAQREVDGLATIGRSYEATWDEYGTGVGHISDPQVGRAAGRFLQSHLAPPFASTPIAITRTVNAAGAPRVLCLFAVRGVTRPIDSVTLIAYVRAPATWTGPLPAAPTTATLPLATFRRALKIDPPTLNANRLLITGTADDVPFAFELTLDANDRPQLFELRAPTSRPAK